MQREIIFRGLSLVVTYDYQPEEKQTYDHPGCHEEWIIEEIFLNGEDITALFEDEYFDDEIIEILKQL